MICFSFQLFKDKSMRLQELKLDTPKICRVPLNNCTILYLTKMIKVALFLHKVGCFIESLHLKNCICINVLDMYEFKYVSFSKINHL